MDPSAPKLAFVVLSVVAVGVVLYYAFQPSTKCGNTSKYSGDSNTKEEDACNGDDGDEQHAPHVNSCTEASQIAEHIIEDEVRMCRKKI